MVLAEYSLAEWKKSELLQLDAFPDIVTDFSPVDTTTFISSPVVYTAIQPAESGLI